MDGDSNSKSMAEDVRKYVMPSPDGSTMSNVGQAFSRRAPILGALLGIQPYRQEKSLYAEQDSEIPGILSEYGSGLESQLNASGIYDEFADQKSRDALNSSTEFKDMVMFQAMSGIAGKALGELQSSDTYKPNVNRITRLARSVGYDLTMGSDGQFYMTNTSDGRNIQLSDENIAKMASMATQRLNERVQKLKMGDSRYSSMNPQGFAMDAVRDSLEPYVGYNDATDFAQASYTKASRGDSSFNRFALSKTWEKLSQQYPDLQQILSDPSRISALPPEQQMLFPAVQKMLSDAGVKTSGVYGRAQLIVDNNAFGVPNGTYELGAFFDELSKADIADGSGFGAQMRNEAERARGAYEARKLAAYLKAQDSEIERQSKALDMEGKALSNEGKSLSNEKIARELMGSSSPEDEQSPFSRSVTRSEMYGMSNIFGDDVYRLKQDDAAEIRNMMSIINKKAGDAGITDLSSLDMASAEDFDRLKALEESTEPYFNIIRDVFKDSGLAGFRNPILEKLNEYRKSSAEKTRGEIPEKKKKADEELKEKGGEPTVRSDAMKFLAGELGGYGAGVIAGDNEERSNAARRANSVASETESRARRMEKGQHDDIVRKLISGSEK